MSAASLNLGALGRPVRRLRARILRQALERKGETADEVMLESLGLAADGYRNYSPSGWRQLKRALKNVPITEDDVFLDVGSGKGRVLVQAMRLRFRRVIGVELSEQLAARARLLITESTRRRDAPVEIAVADATTWAVPDDVTVVYMYNALSGDPLTACLDRVAESVDRAPREVWFLYVNPEDEERVCAHSRFELVVRRPPRVWRAPNDPRRVSVFRAVKTA